jgi:hypothetical protein
VRVRLPGHGWEKVSGVCERDAPLHPRSPRFLRERENEREDLVTVRVVVWVIVPVPVALFVVRMNVVPQVIAVVLENVAVLGNVIVQGSGIVPRSAAQENVIVLGNAVAQGNVVVPEAVVVLVNVIVLGNVIVLENVIVLRNVVVLGMVVVLGNAVVPGNVIVLESIVVENVAVLVVQESVPVPGSEELSGMVSELANAIVIEQGTGMVRVMVGRETEESAMRAQENEAGMVERRRVGVERVVRMTESFPHLGPQLVREAPG